MKFYSQYEQDKFIYETFFKNKFDGAFVEIGADDGIDRSNTYFFEKLGWKGICVEPSLNRFKKLKKNRNCYCENCCIYDDFGVVKFLDIEGLGKGLSGIVSNYSEKHNLRIKRELEIYGNKSIQTLRDVNCVPLSFLLEKYNIKKIDFCSIDTEGSEFNIIKGIDFAKYIFNIIMIENNTRKDNEIKEFMELNGFVFVKRLVADEIYQNNLLKTM